MILSALAAAVLLQIDAGPADDAGTALGSGSFEAAAALDAGAPMGLESFDAPSELEAFDSFPSSGAAVMSVESFDSSPSDGGTPGAVTVESFADEASAVSAQVYGFVRALGGVDTRFDSFRDDPIPENVAELRARSHLGADVKLGERLRLKLEGRGVYRAVTQRGFDRAKATLEPMIGEAFVDLYSREVDLRVGYQLVPFGANPAFAPADALNPRDLRESPLLGEPEDTRLPAFAARALLSVGQVQLSAAYFPFFEPHRYNVFGQDEGFLQPDLEISPRSVAKVDESIEDDVQERLLETRRPRHLPWLGDIGVRATTELSEVTVGASWVWAYEKLPRVSLDPELQRLFQDSAAGREASEAATLSVRNRFQAGEELVHGSYPRNHVFSVEGSTLVSSAQVDADLSVVPAQTLVDDRYDPVRLTTVTWVVGVSQAEDSDLLYNLTYIGMAIPDVPADTLLLILEPTTARGAPRTAFLHGLIGTVGYRLLERKLEASMRFAVEYRGFAAAPKLTYAFSDRVSGILAAEIYAGRKYSPFGYFERNDQVIAGVQLSLF